ncbi:AI-2E family transporter [Microbacterium sp. CJ88]|uniref:AI-2E family transporter n=1 Tax=Microbacterium sp. CJ88 TaxID=3445672 RepID=UPI003F65AA14
MSENQPAAAQPSPSDAAAGSEASIAVSADEAPAGRVFWGRLASPFTVGFGLALGALAAVVLGLAVSNLSTVIIYIAFALFAALGLDPIVKWLERRGVKRVWGIVIVFAGLAIVLVGILWLILPTVIAQISSFVRDIPATIRAFMQTDAYHWLEGMFGEGLNTLIGDLQTFLTNPSNLAAIGGGALQVGVGIFSGISGVVIVLVLTLYFVASLETMKAAFYRLVPARNRARVADLTDEIADSVGSYLMGMVILAFINSIVAFALHAFLQLPFPALMAVLAFLITLIPLVGSVLYWGTASVLALFTSPVAAIIFALVYLIYMQLEAYVLTPRVMSRAISIPGSLVVIGALVGGTLLGLLGALVAIPVTASILLIVKQVLIPRQDAKL